jgi:TusA-related sulfurtransferase
MTRELLLDVRGMPPPEPIARVLDVVDDFLPGDRLQLLTDCPPLPLLKLLASFGYGYREVRGTESRYEITIWRQTPEARNAH